jgi:hypothetical protein
MTCPSCQNSVLSTADKCSCGYRFNGPQDNPAAVLGSIERMVRTIKNVVLWWAILSIFGALAWVLSRV